METLLSAGVHLHVVPKKQFKTTQITVSFTAPQAQVDFAARNLVASLLITSTAKWPSQLALARHLNNLFGATLEAYVMRLGQTHSWRLGLTVINDHLAGEPVFEQAVALINEVLHHPHLSGNGFAATTFARQQKNLVSTLRSWADDKRYYALQQVAETYYDPQLGARFRTPAAGRASQVAALTNPAVVQAYQQMLTQDRVDIMVVGDVDPAAVRAAMAALDWPGRSAPVAATELFYQQPVHPDLWVAREQQPLQQTRLDQAYRLPVTYGGPHYPAALVLNGLLGGSPASLLFTELREGASLAYEANSLLRPFTGHVVVETGIRDQNQARVRQLIAALVQRLQRGQFSATRLARVQAGLVNQYVASLDSPGTFGQAALLASLTGRPALNDLGRRLRAVTKDEVVALAQQLTLQAEFRLEGKK